MLLKSIRIWSIERPIIKQKNAILVGLDGDWLDILVGLDGDWLDILVGLDGDWLDILVGLDGDWLDILVGLAGDWLYISNSSFKGSICGTLLS